jgi:hypothetical protein
MSNRSVGFPSPDKTLKITFQDGDERRYDMDQIANPARMDSVPFQRREATFVGCMNRSLALVMGEGFLYFVFASFEFRVGGEGAFRLCASDGQRVGEVSSLFERVFPIEFFSHRRDLSAFEFIVMMSAR